MSIRDLRNKARKDLHARLSVEANYVLPDGSATPCKVRVHTHISDFGELEGADFSAARRSANAPEVVFLASEVTPVRGGIVVIASDEAYYIERALPRHGITISAETTIVTDADKLATLPAPA